MTHRRPHSHRQRPRGTGAPTFVTFVWSDHAGPWIWFGNVSALITCPVITRVSRSRVCVITHLPTMDIHNRMALTITCPLCSHALRAGRDRVDHASHVCHGLVRLSRQVSARTFVRLVFGHIPQFGVTRDDAAITSHPFAA